MPNIAPSLKLLLVRVSAMGILRFLLGREDSRRT